VSSGGGLGGGPAAPLWIISFADMISNLVIFFILVATYASKTTETNSVPRKILDNQTGVFGRARDRQLGAMVQKPGAHAQHGEVAAETGSKRHGVEADALRSRVQDKRYRVKPRITNLRDGVRIGLDENGLFVAGSDQLSTEGREIVAEIGRFYREENVAFTVEAHTDDRTFRISRWGSDVDLSRAMGVSVALVLQQESAIEPPRIGISPFGAERPVESNATASGRAKNRRVEIVVREQR
jgi:chemotaxis protein MotB